MPYVVYYQTTNLTGLPYEALAKYGGEDGIRTHDTPLGIYTISNRALSTTQTPLQSNLLI